VFLAWSAEQLVGCLLLNDLRAVSDNGIRMNRWQFNPLAFGEQIVMHLLIPLLFPSCANFDSCVELLMSSFLNEMM
jgi:hypothetical protein